MKNLGNFALQNHKTNKSMPQQSFSLRGNFSKKYFIFLIIFLGAISAFGPFVTDMYLPTLPAMQKGFDTTTSMVQMGLTASMIGIALGQIFLGPISDKYGRRPVLIFSMIIFSIAALASVFAPDINIFLVTRLFQGIGGAGGIVLSRSIATDTYSGRDLAKIMAIIGAINGIAPITAPIIGGFAADFAGWRGIFVILFLLGLIIFAMTLKFKESLRNEHRFNGRIFSTFKSYLYLAKNTKFVVYVLTYAFAISVLFAYIASAPFIIQNHYGYSEMGFSIIFSINAITLAIGTTVSVKFRRLDNASLSGSVISFILSIILIINVLTIDNFLIYELIMFFVSLGLGFIFTTATASAMNAGRKYIGAASAVVGASGFLFGGIVSPLAGIGNVVISTAVSFIICSSLALLCILVVRKIALKE